MLRALIAEAAIHRLKLATCLNPVTLSCRWFSTVIPSIPQDPTKALGTTGSNMPLHSNSDCTCLFCFL